MNWINKIDQVITKTLEAVVSIFFIIIFGLVFLLAMLRYVFSSSIMGANEIITILFVYCSSLGVALMVRNKENIRISYFINLLPLPIKKIVSTINYILIMGLNGVFVYLSMGWIRSTGSFKSQLSGIPFWVVEFSIPIGCGVVVLYCLKNILMIYVEPDSLDEIDGELKDALEQATVLLNSNVEKSVPDLKEGNSGKAEIK